MSNLRMRPGLGMIPGLACGQCGKSESPLALTSGGYCRGLRRGDTVGLATLGDSRG